MGEDAVYNSINSMIEESKYCSDIEKIFNKELVITKENDEHFENSTKYWIYDNVYVDGDVKVKIIAISLEHIEALHLEIVY